ALAARSQGIASPAASHRLESRGYALLRPTQRLAMNEGADAALPFLLPLPPLSGIDGDASAVAQMQTAFSSKLTEPGVRGAAPMPDSGNAVDGNERSKRYNHATLTSNFGTD